MKNNDNRQSPRTPLRMAIHLINEEAHVMQAHTWDVSDGGIFVELPKDQHNLFPIGKVASSQVQGLPFPAPIVKIEAVRHTDKGIGFSFKPED